MKKKKLGWLGVNRVKEVLRLNELGINKTQISKSVKVTRGTVRDYIRKSSALGITFTNFSSYSDEELRKLFGKGKSGRRSKSPDPDFCYMQKELCRKEVTLQILWEEYLKEYPDGLSYSGFCARYRDWKRAKKITLRQEHKAGEKVFVDYCGVTVTIYPTDGEVFNASIFVGCLGTSNLIYAEATQGEDSSSWLSSHVRMFNYFGGVPRAVVPDNLKSGVTSPCYYEPGVNRSYQELAEYYDLAVIPARVRKPQDKAKAESAVQVVEYQIIARLRKERLTSLGELNSKFKELLEVLNNKEMKTYGCSRFSLFEDIEKETLSPLPAQPFKVSHWKLAKINIDYHVEINSRFYSVPYQLRGEEVEVQISEKSISIYQNNKQIAVHAKVKQQGGQSTNKEHMPPEHRFMQEWSPSKFQSWATEIGSETRLQIDSMLKSCKHPEQGYRACLGLLRLAKKHGDQRLEQACKRANYYGIISFKSIQSILQTGQESVSIEQPGLGHTEVHKNIRGNRYYH